MRPRERDQFQGRSTGRCNVGLRLFHFGKASSPAQKFFGNHSQIRDWIGPLRPLQTLDSCRSVSFGLHSGGPRIKGMRRCGHCMRRTDRRELRSSGRACERYCICGAAQRRQHQVRLLQRKTPGESRNLRRHHVGEGGHRRDDCQGRCPRARTCAHRTGQQRALTSRGIPCNLRFRLPDQPSYLLEILAVGVSFADLPPLDGGRRNIEVTGHGRKAERRRETEAVFGEFGEWAFIHGDRIFTKSVIARQPLFYRLG